MTLMPQRWFVTDDASAWNTEAALNDGAFARRTHPQWGLTALTLDVFADIRAAGEAYWRARWGADAVAAIDRLQDAEARRARLAELAAVVAMGYPHAAADILDTEGVYLSPDMQLLRDGGL